MHRFKRKRPTDGRLPCFSIELSDGWARAFFPFFFSTTMETYVCEQNKKKKKKKKGIVDCRMCKP